MSQELSKREYVESIIQQLVELEDLELCDVIAKAVTKKDSNLVYELLSQEALEYWIDYSDLLKAISKYENFIEDLADITEPRNISDLITFENCHKIAYYLGYDGNKEEVAKGLFEELAYIKDKRGF